MSRKAAPRIGISTIKKEKRATSSFFVPSRRPVAIVEPLREIPGITATACAMPIINALKNVIFPSLAFIKLGNASKNAVKMSMLPTNTRLPVKSSSI